MWTWLSHWSVLCWGKPSQLPLLTWERCRLWSSSSRLKTHLGMPEEHTARGRGVVELSETSAAAEVEAQKRFSRKHSPSFFSSTNKKLYLRWGQSPDPWGLEKYSSQVSSHLSCSHSEKVLKMLTRTLISSFCLFLSFYLSHPLWWQGLTRWQSWTAIIDGNARALEAPFSSCHSTTRWQCSCHASILVTLTFTRNGNSLQLWQKVTLADTVFMKTFVTHLNDIVMST